MSANAQIQDEQHSEDTQTVTVDQFDFETLKDAYRANPQALNYLKVSPTNTNEVALEIVDDLTMKRAADDREDFIITGVVEEVNPENNFYWERRITTRGPYIESDLYSAFIEEDTEIFLANGRDKYGWGGTSIDATPAALADFVAYISMKEARESIKAAMNAPGRTVYVRLGVIFELIQIEQSQSSTEAAIDQPEADTEQCPVDGCSYEGENVTQHLAGKTQSCQAHAEFVRNASVR